MTVLRSGVGASTDIVLVGAGRAGLRHLAGAVAFGNVHVVDVRPEAEPDVRALGATFGTSLADAPTAEIAILATTANGRLEQLELLAERGVRSVLVEKPVEQSRARVRRVAEIASATGIRGFVHLHRRENPWYRALHARGGPYRLTAVGGAFGMACNGIHYLDLAVFLARSRGRLMHVDLDHEPIGSGRGDQFRDYGGRASFRFEDGTHLYVDSWSTSSAPELVTIVQRDAAVVSDGESALTYERSEAKPNTPYRYGAGWSRAELLDFETLRGGETTARWLAGLRGEAPLRLPSLGEALPAHELLFDVLETTGASEFPIA